MTVRTTRPLTFSFFRSLKLTRNAEVEFQANNGPLIFRPQDHTEFV